MQALGCLLVFHVSNMVNALVSHRDFSGSCSAIVTETLPTTPD